MTNEKTKRIEKLADDLMNGELPGEWTKNDNIITQEIKITMTPYALPLPKGQRLGMWDISGSNSGNVKMVEMISSDARLFARLDKDNKIIRLDKNDKDTDCWIPIMKNLPNDKKCVAAVKAALREAADFLEKETEEEYRQRKQKEENLKNLDTGFRVLKQVDDPDSLEGLDRVFACAVELGQEFTKEFGEEEIDGKTVYTYGGNDLVCCFEYDVPDSVVRAIAEKKPTYAVFFDGIDEQKVKQIFAEISPETIIKVMM